MPIPLRHGTLTLAAGAVMDLYSMDVSNPSGEPRFSRQWRAMLLGGAVVLVAVALLPVDSIERSIVARGAGIVASLIFILSFQGLPKSVRSVWFCLGGFLILTAIADVIYDYQSLILKVPPFPGTADIFYLATYVFAVIGLIILARKLIPGADLSSWIDISIMVVAAAGLVGAFVIGPVWSSNEQWDLATVLSLVYPLLDLVLLAALVRVLMLPHARNAAITLLATSMGLFLAYDLIYNNQILAAVWTPISEMEVLWTAAMLCIPLAALSPGARRFDPVDPSQAGAVTTTRQLIIGISVMAIPAIVLLELFITSSAILRWLVPVILLLLALVLARLHLLLRASQRQAAALAELSQADFLTGLPNRQTWDEQLQIIAANELTTGGVMSIAILDIDNFAYQRQAQGQHISDLLLVSATLAWLAELTTDDLLARYGTEQFALLIQRDSMSEAQDVLRRIVRASPQGLAISSGVALLRPDEHPVDAALRAEGAMHASRSVARQRFELEQEFSN